MWGYDIRVKNGFLGMFRNVKVGQFKDMLHSGGGFVAIIVELFVFAFSSGGLLILDSVLVWFMVQTSLFLHSALGIIQRNLTVYLFVRKMCKCVQLCFECKCNE